MTSYDAEHRAISGFVAWMRQRTDTRMGNLLAMSVGDWHVYLRMLGTISLRYHDACARLVEATQRLMEAIPPAPGVPYADPSQLLTATAAAQTAVRLEVESYLLFACVLLNKMANFPRMYFDHVSRVGLAFGSHARYWKTLRKKPFHPEHLGDTAAWLTSEVIGHRDLYIVHTDLTDNTRRELIRAISGSPGDARVANIVLYPDEAYHREKVSPSLLEVDDKLRAYVHGTLQFLQEHVGISVLIEPDATIVTST